MKIRSIGIGLAVLALFAGAFGAAAQGTAFTYQGRLQDGTGPATGVYDLRFTIHDGVTNGNAVGGTVTNVATSVSNGLFVAALDFGTGVFTGADRWLEISVRTNGGGVFATLTPRQKLTATPYAITAGNVTGPLGAGSLSGNYSNAVTFNNASNQFTGTFTGNGGGLTNVNAQTLGGLSSSNLWKTTGNSGTSPGVNFLGTTDNQPLVLAVNGQEAMRYEPTTETPNVVGGWISNYVQPGLAGVTIGGGGSAIPFNGSPQPNVVTNNGYYATIAGGYNNTVKGYGGIVVGGSVNSVIGNFGLIGGGQLHLIDSDAGYSVIGGGYANIIETNAQAAFVAGGGANTIRHNTFASSIGGGYGNTNGATYGAVGGGVLNRIEANNLAPAIAGGERNVIRENVSWGFIGGGNLNEIQSGSGFSVIAGGSENVIEMNAGFSLIGGGLFNSIEPFADQSVIAGGNANLIQGGARESFIGGGFANAIQTNAGGSFIGGGILNTNGPGAVYSTIGGGIGGFNGGYAGTIAGGYYNTVTSNSAAIGGGGFNFASGINSVVAGGSYNRNAANNAAIGGGEGNSISNSAPHATIAGGLANQSDAGASFIGGGSYNVNHGPGAVIGGGIANRTENFDAVVGGGGGNVNAGYRSFIGSGEGNAISNSGSYATIGGGLQNRTAGDFGVVPGGRENAADGDYSFAAGRRAKANHQGAFVWADSRDTNFTSTASNQFLIRASGGVGIGTNNPASALHVAGTITAANFSGSPSGLSGTITNPISFNPPTGAPFAVGNATRVTNLNADLLDGLDATAFWKTTGNSGTSPGVNFLGTTDNQSLELKVNGARALRLEPNASGAPNVIGGSPVNVVSPGVVGATIAGGGATNFSGGAFINSVSGNFGTVGGGLQNENSGELATVGGGIYHTIGTNGYQSAIGGGFRNTIETFNSTIGGGADNTIRTNSQYSTIGGGVNNRIFSGALLSAIGGGSGNLIENNARYSTIPGGVANTAAGQSSFAAGYRAKAMHQGTFVWADSQEVDFMSSASNQFLVRATGGVGINTTNPGAMLQVGDVETTNSQGMIRLASRSGTGPASRYWDIGVPEGDEDTDNEFYSFVIDDPQTGTEPELVIRWQTGDVGIGTVKPQSRLHAVAVGGNGVQGDSSDPSASGVYGENFSGRGYGVAGRTIDDGVAVFGENTSPSGYAGYFNGNVLVNGTVCANNIACPSDRNVKSGFEAVDPKSILEKVAALSITRWRYTNDTATPHVGPVAQDFYAAFGVGSDDKHISTVDADGVALAAIQGLNQKVEERHAALAEQFEERGAEIVSLREEVKQLKALVSKLAEQKSQSGK